MKIRSKKFQYLLHTVSQIDKWFLRFFVIALLVLLNYETGFVKRFWENQFTKGLNQVIVQILYAYVTGFMFYVFVELIPKHKKVISLFRLVNNNIHKISEYMDALLNEICLTNSELEQGYKVSGKQFGSLCKEINIYNRKVKTWFYPEDSFRNYVLWTCEKIKINVEQIASYSDLLNDDWINRLSHIQDTVQYVEDLLELNQDRSTLSTSSHHLWVLYGEVKELDKMSQEYFNRYHRIHNIKNPPGSYFPKDLYFEVKNGKNKK